MCMANHLSVSIETRIACLSMPKIRRMRSYYCILHVSKTTCQSRERETRKKSISNYLAKFTPLIGYRFRHHIQIQNCSIPLRSAACCTCCCFHGNVAYGWKKSTLFITVIILWGMTKQNNELKRKYGISKVFHIYLEGSFNEPKKSPKNESHLKNQQHRRAEALRHSIYAGTLTTFLYHHELSFYLSKCIGFSHTHSSE